MSNVRPHMHGYLRNIDGKVLLFASLACYVLPALLFGTLVLVALGDGTSELGQKVAMVLLPCWLLLSPLAAGYFTARFSARLPQLHVALVGLVGVAICLAKVSGSLAVQAGFAASAFAACALGGFIR